MLVKLKNKQFVSACLFMVEMRGVVGTKCRNSEMSVLAQTNERQPAGV